MLFCDVTTQFTKSAHLLMKLTLTAIFTLSLSGCLFCDQQSQAQTATTPAPDFLGISDVDEKKQTFIEYLTPLVHKANQKVLAERVLINNMRDWKSRGRWIRPVLLDQLIQLAAKYRVNAELLSDEYFDMMLLKIDAVPLSLAVAQAATESGWGTSRFARKGNNFFGQWCFKKGCGLVPQSRKESMRHEVARFESPLISVESYILNLNRHSKYSGFRAERAKMRESMQPLSGLSLVSELRHYSERRQDYIQDIKSIIRSNDLSALDS